jgi:predicted phosphodiesterase
MKLAVISDLHLGPGDPSDRFEHGDESFLRFLDFLEAEFEQIVLLGDIWETLTPTRGFSARRGLRESRQTHARLAARFERPAYHYVHGNHDYVAREVDSAPEELILEADGTRLLFTHGHLHDKLVTHARWVSESGVWIGGWLRRFGLGALYQRIDQLDRGRAGAQVDPARCSFQRWAVELARERGADVVVTGHTHLPLRAEHGDRLFMNSGTCSDGKLTFLALDTRAGTFAVRHDW